MSNKISFADKLEVVLLHGKLSIAIGKRQEAALLALNYPDGAEDCFRRDTNVQCWWFDNYEEMGIDCGDIVQFCSAKQFVIYVYGKIMLSNAQNQ